MAEVAGHQASPRHRTLSPRPASHQTPRGKHTPLRRRTHTQQASPPAIISLGLPRLARSCCRGCCCLQRLQQLIRLVPTPGQFPAVGKPPRGTGHESFPEPSVVVVPFGAALAPWRWLRPRASHDVNVEVDAAPVDGIPAQLRLLATRVRTRVL
jgi:hypothetical protein